MNKKTFFVTTPIYYTNWIPHIGHAYSSIIADIIAKYKRINWYEVKFSTWVDENSQKAVMKAEELKMKTKPYLDMMAAKHKDVWDWLNISYTDFIRTTESRHFKLVQEVLQKSYKAWDIYEWEYEWFYCVGCEAFKKTTDLTQDWLCPDHLTKPEVIKEKNWFFRLSKYENFLKDYYKNNPDFVIPSNRFNEVIEFVKWWLDDFSISRETNKIGIPLPFDPTHVTYVWYDALFNYVTVCTEEENPGVGLETLVLKLNKFWPADLHIVGKDIIRFHAIYWPAMLKSAWYELPKNILTTWFFTVDWQKISKSLGNVIDPVEFSQKYSRDLMSLYLLSAFPIGQDWDFSEEQAITMFNAKLANNLGNLLNRVLVLSLKIGGELKKPKDLKYEAYLYNENKDWEIDNVIWNPLSWTNKLKRFTIKKFELYDLKWVLDDVFKYCDIINNYTTKEEPWKMISEWKTEEAEKVLYIIAEWLRNIAILFYPFFTEKMSEMLVRLWLEDYPQELEHWKMEELLARSETFKIKEKWEPLYMRI